MMSMYVAYFTIIVLSFADTSDSKYDILNPYEKKFGGKLKHRQVRDCQPLEYGKVPYEIDNIVHSGRKFSLPDVEVKSFIHRTKTGMTGGHVAFVEDPMDLFSVEESLNGGCKQRAKSKVSEVARQLDCAVALNAGFFNSTSGFCYGNVISNGKLVKDSAGIQNVNFGITKQNELFVGYLPEELLKNNSKEFLQLITGVVWLVRDGKVFINHSKEIECEDTQESENFNFIKGTFERFINIRSARTSIGYDKDGRIIIAHVNGKTDIYGINLWEMADLMVEFGAVNAINLDGGGSATFAVNGTVTNQLSDDCDDKRFRCERKVTTVLCVKNKHACNGHGKIINNICACSKGWEGPYCKQAVDSTTAKNVSSNESSSKRDLKIVYVIIVVVASSCIIVAIVNIVLCSKFAKMKNFRRETDTIPISTYTNLNLSSSDDEKTIF